MTLCLFTFSVKYKRVCTVRVIPLKFLHIVMNGKYCAKFGPKKPVKPLWKYIAVNDSRHYRQLLSATDEIALAVVVLLCGINVRLIMT